MSRIQNEKAGSYRSHGRAYLILDDQPPALPSSKNKAQHETRMARQSVTPLRSSCKLYTAKGERPPRIPDSPRSAWVKSPLSGPSDSDGTRSRTSSPRPYSSSRAPGDTPPPHRSSPSRERSVTPTLSRGCRHEPPVETLSLNSTARGGASAEAVLPRKSKRPFSHDDSEDIGWGVRARRRLDRDHSNYGSLSPSPVSPQPQPRSDRGYNALHCSNSPAYIPHSICTTVKVHSGACGFQCESELGQSQNPGFGPMDIELWPESEEIALQMELSALNITI